MNEALDKKAPAIVCAALLLLGCSSERDAGTGGTGSGGGGSHALGGSSGATGGGGMSYGGSSGASGAAGTLASGGTSGGSAGTVGSAGITGSGGKGTAEPGDLVVDFADIKQKMDGFGASDRNSGTLSDAQADLLFSPTAGAGLSLLRVSINPSGEDSTAYTNATKAAAYGVKIWGAPWTPPADWKDNCSRQNGGHLCASAAQNGGCQCTGSHYDDWASELAGFAAVMKSNAGVDVYAVSVQNEPDYTAGYDSCIYTNAEMTNFVNVLGPKLAALNPAPKLMISDTSGWNAVWSYYDAALADATAAGYIGVLATHQYFLDDPPGHEVPAGKPLWQTEVSSFEGYDGGIGNGLKVAHWIHNAIVHADVSAWHYWELINTSDNQGVYNGTS
ncbi:MAG TPA: hypothetical protein VGP93_08615, partial [Polyangiaceae bacterium]|nr:hypothetical protein [Polyangiaceae bacterium]